MTVWLNLGCGTHRAPAPWINVDCIETATTHPDVIVKAGDPLPWADGEADRVYLGHVLEHVPWPAVPAFLAEVRRVLDGDLFVTGPDVHRTIEQWHDGQVSWSLVLSVMEHAAHVELDNGWPEAHHHWNCHEARVVEALELAGFVDIEPADIFHPGDGWPIMNPSTWQLAVSAR